MSRNTRFHPSHEPLRSSNTLQLQHDQVSGPFRSLNPTTAQYRHIGLSKPLDFADELYNQTSDSLSDPEKAHPSANEQGASDVQFQWRSRDNRKGRHALLVARDDSRDAKYITPKTTSSVKEVLEGIGRMATKYPYWDVSYLVAIIFTLGSVVWVINSFFVWLPLVDPSTEFPGEIGKAGGITAFIGATIFEVGSVLLMFEAVNEHRSGCFGWALERALEGGRVRVRPDHKGCSHHHGNRRNLIGKTNVGSRKLNWNSTDSDASHEKRTARSSDDQGKGWQWFPSWHDLTTHYIRELGFVACSAQFCGATVFWISGFTALPGIANHLTSQALLNGVFWVPQIVGGTGFIVSGTLFMLETQPKWYIPAPKVLGWHIGFWNLIGAFGFTLCGALGPAYGNSGAQFQSSLATFWGSWAFLIGSVVQCFITHSFHEPEYRSWVSHPELASTPSAHRTADPHVRPRFRPASLFRILRDSLQYPPAFPTCRSRTRSSSRASTPFPISRLIRKSLSRESASASPSDLHVEPLPIHNPLFSHNSITANLTG